MSIFAATNPISIIDTPIHCILDNCSDNTTLAVRRPVIGTSKDIGDILLKGYFDIRSFQNP